MKISRLAVRIALAAVLLVGTVDQAFAGRNKRFYDGLHNPGQLAELIEANLAAERLAHPDPDYQLTGSAMIDPARCAPPHWSCAAPADYLKIINQFDRRASVDGQLLTRVDQLPAFLRKLQIQDPPDGAFWMACMAKAPAAEPTPSGYRPIAECLPRKFHPGEKAWVDPDTNRIVLAEDCTNPVGRPFKPPPCAYKMVWVEEGDQLLLEGYGPTDTSKDECTGLLMPGDSDYERVDLERCEHPDCEIDTNGTALYARQWSGSVQAEQSGWAIVRGPMFETQEGSGYQDYFCIHRGATDFFGLGVRWFDYLQRSNSLLPLGDQSVAVIEPDYATALSHGRTTRVEGQRSILWWDIEPSHFQEHDSSP